MHENKRLKHPRNAVAKAAQVITYAYRANLTEIALEIDERARCVSHRIRQYERVDEELAIHRDALGERRRTLKRVYDETTTLLEKAWDDEKTLTLIPSLRANIAEKVRYRIAELASHRESRSTDISDQCSAALQRYEHDLYGAMRLSAERTYYERRAQRASHALRTACELAKMKILRVLPKSSVEHELLRAVVLRTRPPRVLIKQHSADDAIDSLAASEKKSPWDRQESPSMIM